MEEDGDFVSLRVSEIQSLLSQLTGGTCQDEERIGLLAERILQIVESLPSHLSNPTLSGQLHVAAVTLWNKVVFKKSDASLSLSLNAQLRHVALSLVFLCASPNENSAQLLKKQITMAIKTGRAWLECDNPMMAETSLELANQCWLRLSKSYEEGSVPTDTLVLYFKILCSQIEAFFGIGNHEKAIEMVDKAKEIIGTQDKDMGHLSMLCYNCGLQEFQNEKHSNAVQWFKESYDIGRGCNAVGAVKQARSLRLLAKSYLEWDGTSHWQKALNAVGLANSEHFHLSGLFLKLSILMQYVKQKDRITTAFNDVLSHPELSLDIGSAAVKLAIENKQPELAFNALQLLKQTMKSPSDRQALQQLHLELLLDNGMFGDAKQLIEECIENHSRSDPLDMKTIQQFHIILWSQASKSYDKEDYDSALDWYRYSLLLFPSDASHDKNIAKLQRNISNCHIQMADLNKAKDAIDQSLLHDKESAHSHYLAFKIGVLVNNTEQALQSLQMMMECVQDADLHGLVAMSAQLAFENHNRDVALYALENLVQTSSNQQQVLTSLRCLIRLKLTFFKNEDTPSNKLVHLSSLLKYTELASNHLTECVTGNGPLGLLSSSQKDEVLWFSKIAWNIALEAGDYYKEMMKAFDICQKLYHLLPHDISIANRIKTCRLMSAAAGLQAARQTENKDEQVIILKDVLSHIQGCREFINSRSIRGGGGAVDMSPSGNSILSLLCLYEFETQLVLGSPDAVHILDVVKASCPSPDPKTYENIAALAIRYPLRDGSTALIVKKSLQIAIDLHMNTNPRDTEKLSHCTHSLVDILLANEYSTDMSAKEEAKQILLLTYKLISEDKYPEMEIAWHMTKTWNTGIYLYSMMRLQDAEQWCSLAMKFLPHLSKTLCNTYQDQMTSVYTEIIDKISLDAQKHQL
ncbi:PREDICTED: testis-expressed sequence 11 protein-like [Amphimedon queenslandica]|uniref:Protein ZIP4 homolog n=1 Tax=Amphimedon queenslandica TaxID=400682 RepID=A0AAN0J4A5_AMPQE|nr:PREDICTED: testis-expressed sequence 11 protein-like [Amphimedon queenslandica]|eukprot:XP_019851830.1 PREDICTED: testis-expressed sequence 11 protein-like [Amphimedon queenslandica]